MKKLILLLLLLSSLNIWCQDDNDILTKSKSKAIEFSEREGILLRKEFVSIGRESGIEFENVHLTNISSKDKEGYSALRMIWEGYIGTLDSDEIEGCIKSLEYIKDQVENTKPDVYTELIYKSRDKIIIGARYTTGSYPKWTFVIKFHHSDVSTKNINIKNIPKVIETLNSAKEKLNERK